MKNPWDLVTIDLVCLNCKEILQEKDVEILGTKTIDVNKENGELGKMEIYIHKCKFCGHEFTVEDISITDYIIRDI